MATHDSDFQVDDDKFWMEGPREWTLSLYRARLRNLFPDADPVISDAVHCTERKDGEDSYHGIPILTKGLPAFDATRSYNQLGLKDYFLQRAHDADKHNRYRHACGTALIGNAYFRAVEPFFSQTIYKDLLQEQAANGSPILPLLLNAALLLHDVGHLPFSHLMEEVFRELNWTRGGGELHRHDEAPIEQLGDGGEELLSRAISEMVGEDRPERLARYSSLVNDLIAGSSGVPYLDAIVNSALDADKIDYIFRDLHFTGEAARLEDHKAWLAVFLSNLTLSPHGFVCLNGQAAEKAFQLWEERRYLYSHLYLSPGIRAMERIAITIIASWLTRVVPPRLHMGAPLHPDLREAKGKLAYERLALEFKPKEKSKQRNEFQVLISLCEQLGENQGDSGDGAAWEWCEYQDDAAREWFKQLTAILRTFLKEGDPGSALSSEYQRMLVEEPLYFMEGDERVLRELARDLHVGYPCGVLIDVASFPRLLATPRSRRPRVSGRSLEGEQFLVPGPDVGKWGPGNRPATYPLHLCNFGLGPRLTQVVVINTTPGEVQGSYVYDLLLQRCRDQGLTRVTSTGRAIS